jgi:hypothetical protein
LLLFCAASMKTKLAIIEEKAAKLQNGWSAQQTLQKRAAAGESPPSKSVDRSLKLPLAVRPPEPAPDKVTALQRIVRERNAEIQDLQVRLAFVVLLPPKHTSACTTYNVMGA